MTDIEIIRVELIHHADIMHHMLNNFFLHEPINAYLKLVTSSEPGANPRLEEKITSILKEDLSFVAVNLNKTLIGVSLNSIRCTTHLKDLEETSEKTDDSKTKLVFDLFSYFEKHSDVYRRFNVKETFDCVFLSVDKSSRGRGVGSALLSASIQLAEQHGYTLFRVDCSSDYTRRIAVKLGFQQAYSIRYNQYRPIPNKEPPILPEVPHQEFTCYVLHLGN